MMCIFLACGILVSIFDHLPLTLAGFRSSDLADESTNHANKDSAVKFPQIRIDNLFRKVPNNISVRLKRHESKQKSKINKLFHEFQNKGATNNEKRRNLTEKQALDIFKRDWCRIQRARLEWKEILGPCWNSTVWEAPKKLGINQISDPGKSFISHWDIRPTGEFSRFVIQSVSTSNDLKTTGGDSWRIHIHGPSSLAPTVFDHNNGSYEVLFLILEDGNYEAKIFLDYSLCHGFKDPPPYWFKKGNVWIN